MPENSTEEGTKSTRDTVARQILENRSFDRGNAMTTNRSGEEYIQFLGGLQPTTEYARILPGKRWLDIGAGTTKGLSEIAKSSLGVGLNVEATVLNRSEEVRKYLGTEHTHITSAETLWGIPDGAYSLVTGLNSVAYSVAPQMIIDSIDRVLEPGGVFQGTFQDMEKASLVAPMNPYAEFKKAFEDKGYDTAVVKNPDEETGVYILLAVKEGATISAQSLLERNLQSLPPIPSVEQEALRAKADIGYGLGLDLLGETVSVEAINNFVQEELIGNRGFSPEEADLTKQKLVERFLKFPQPIGERILGNSDPRLLTEDQFNSSPDLLFHGSKEPFVFDRNADYTTLSTPYSSTVGRGFYTTDRAHAEIFSKLKKNDFEGEAHITSVLPYQARVFDFREEGKIANNASVPTELFDGYITFIQSYFDQKFPQDSKPSLTPPLSEEAVEFIDLHRYLTALKRLKTGSEPVDLRAMLSMIGDATVPEYGSVHFNRFMTDKGFDGIVYIEGGDDLKHFNNPVSFVFFNLNNVGTFDSWHQQTV